VRRYFRVQGIPHLGGPDRRRADQRLLLLLDGDVVVAAKCHWQGSATGTRHFVFAAVELGYQGGRLSDGQRASDVLGQVIVNDMLGRPGDSPRTVVARVHCDNVRSLCYCQRIGPLPGGPGLPRPRDLLWATDLHLMTDNSPTSPSCRCERSSVSSEKYSGGRASSRCAAAPSVGVVSL
jgi:hypothetical protein